MYKKIVFTKSSSQNMEEINSLARTAIKDFLVSKGWIVKEDLSNGCNFCLIKNFNNQNNSDNFENNKSVLNFYGKNGFITVLNGLLLTLMVIFIYQFQDHYTIQEF